MEKEQILNLKNPEVRNIDKLWAQILWEDRADEVLEEALSHLKLLTLKRNGGK